MQRPDPMIASKPGAQDTEAMSNRVKWLDCLYLHDGRDKRDHPMHGIYTGLAQKYQQFIG
jgi:hypothetical protein|tara:strand:- start:461 stop:640 length:180 start_codon:yes stop_codon:yes gene_type:complete